MVIILLINKEIKDEATSSAIISVKSSKSNN
jgi:hypothetical protein